MSESTGQSVDKTSANVSGMFADIAPRYDFMNRLLSGFVDVYWRRKTAKLVPLGPNGSYLDLCTGTGDLLLEYARRYGRTADRLIGSDFCEPMLETGRKKVLRKCSRLIEQGKPEIELVFGDMCSLPFPSDEFDVATVSFGLRNTVDPRVALQEMVRVLKPGGYGAVLEFTMPTGRLVGPLYRWYFRRILPLLGRLLAPNSFNAYNYLPASVEQFPQNQQLVDMMTECGWTDVTFRSMTFGIAALYIGRKPSDDGSQPVVSVTARG